MAHLMNDTPSSASPATPPKGDRIAKTLSRAGIASRREAERMIEAGRVTVNGAIITSAALNVTAEDRIIVDGKPVGQPEPARLWLYHKPTGLVSTDSDDKGRETIYDDLPADMPRVMSVGRLDLNSEGLLLLTNDGAIKRKLELPSTGWLRRYRVRVNGRPTDEDLEPLRQGIIAEGEPFQPMEVVLDRQKGANAWLTVGLREGKNREIRRAMDEIGLSVNRLIRVSYGPFQLGELKQGAVEEIRRKVLRDQLGAEAEALLGAAPAAPTEVKRGFKRRTVYKKGEMGGRGQPGLPKAPEEMDTGRPNRGKSFKKGRPDKATREKNARDAARNEGGPAKPRVFKSAASKARSATGPKTPRRR
jgi:23S rRNA pseudouridine2605 synthase